MTDTRDAEEIERDLERTRARLDDHLSELQDRMSPGPLLGEALDYVNSGGRADLAHDLAEGARNNPFPILMIGAGIVWLLAADWKPAASSSARPAFASDDLRAYEEDALSKSLDRASTGGPGMPSWTRGLDPLALGAIAVSLGAVLGSLFKPGIRERRIMGNTAMRLKEDARDAAQALMERGNQVVRDGISAARVSASSSRPKAASI